MSFFRLKMAYFAAACAWSKPRRLGKLA